MMILSLIHTKAFAQRLVAAIAAAVCFGVVSPAWAGPIPEGYSTGRYSGLWQKSPFTISSTGTDAPQAGFAQDLALVGIACIGDKNLVTLFNKHSQERFIVGSDPDPRGLAVVSVAMDQNPLKATVTLRKGSETATVGFDKASLAMQTPAAAPVRAAAPMQPATGPAAGNSVPAPVLNLSAVSLRHYREAGVPPPIPGNPAPPAAPAP